MKTLKTASGDLLKMADQGLFDVIIHGCNCQNTMGSGIARQIKDRYPQAYQADTNHHRLFGSVNGKDQIGTYSLAKSVTAAGNDLYIVNAYTQIHYLPRGVDHFEYGAFARILLDLTKRFPTSRFGLPYIGMGLAGGNEEEIKSIIYLFAKVIKFQGGSVTLVEYKS